MSQHQRRATAIATRRSAFPRGPIPGLPGMPSDITCECLSPTRTYFAPEATVARWDGETLIVQFREVGLATRTATTVSVLGEGTADTVYEHDDEILCSLHSEVSVTDEALYPVSDDGTTGSTLVLHLAAHVSAAGWSGAMATVRRSFFATVRDLDTGAVAYLSGPASAGQHATRGQHAT